MTEHPNELVELDIDTVAHGGVTVARLDGRVVFVADAIPGERVAARLVSDPEKSASASFWRADTVEVLRASADRVPHVWSAASIERDPEQRAGGAEFGHIALARQRSLKGEVLTDALRRMGGIDRVVEVEAPVAEHPDAEGSDAVGPAAEHPALADGLRWRTRMRLHVGADGRVGPYAARSHTVVAVDDLPLATAALEEAAALGRPVDDAVAVEFVETSSGEVRVSRIVAELSKTGGRRGPGARGGSGRGRDRGRGGAASGAGRATPGTIVERVGDREFQLAENGFWQVHRDAARTLTQAVQQLTRADLFDPRAANHDLYGGVGLLAAALGDRFGPATRITSVESESSATDHAAENLAEWMGARAVTARVDRYLSDLERQASADERHRLAAATMVIDPPRAGAGKAVVGALTRLGVAQVVYVACDPVAFARDVGLFRAQGYELDTVRAYDLFPHTHHVETVGVLVRA